MQGEGQGEVTHERPKGFRKADILLFLPAVLFGLIEVFWEQEFKEFVYSNPLVILGLFIGINITCFLLVWTAIKSGKR